MTIRDTAPRGGEKLRAGAELDVAFTDLLANGQAVGRAAGMVVFCFGPLPGERARVRIVTVKQRYAVAEMQDLLALSPDRTQPFCAVFGACGGCQLQHLAYPAQLAWKRDSVRSALQRIGGFADVDVAETIGSKNARGYRNKMALVVDHRSAPASLGFYRQRSHDIVPVDACPIVTPELDANLASLRALRDRPDVAAMLEQARHVVARSAHATGQVVLTVTSARPSDAAASAAPVLLAEMPGLVGASNSYDPAGENAILGRHHRLLAGEAEIEETIGGLRLRVSAASFFQVNVAIVAEIFAFLDANVTYPQRVVDLYCGAGTFALHFAQAGASVVGIEEDARAVAEAIANARLNGLEQAARFQAGRVEEVTGAGALANAEAVFLDPPRKGCDEAVLAAIAHARVPQLWYLSCDAATLARDLKFLVANGYRFHTVQPFDMFPQTGHVETLVLLEYSDFVSRLN